MRTFLLFMGLLTSSCYAQISFEPGYYIDNKNQKTTGLIRNSDWLNNPSFIDFKASKDAETITLDKNQVKEFFVGLNQHYIRFELKVDISAANIQDLTTTPLPDWKTEQTLIKIIAEGPTNLYFYRDHSLTRYFYSKAPHNSAEQLIYKEYRNSGNSIFQNNAFRQQLLQLFGEQGLTVAKINQVNYNEAPLSKLFILYGANSLETSLTEKKPKHLLHLNASLGASIYNADFIDAYRGRSTKISGTGFNPELEMEYMFNYSKQKWSGFIGIGYQTNKSDENQYKFEYTFIPVSVGVRYGIFVAADSKIVLEAGVRLNVAMNSKLKYVYSQYSSPEFEISQSAGPFVGTGYTWKRISLTGRYNFSQQLLKYNIQSIKYSSIDIGVKYRIL